MLGEDPDGGKPLNNDPPIVIDTVLWPSVTENARTKVEFSAVIPSAIPISSHPALKKGVLRATFLTLKQAAHDAQIRGILQPDPASAQRASDPEEPPLPTTFALRGGVGMHKLSEGKFRGEFVVVVRYYVAKELIPILQESVDTNQFIKLPISFAETFTSNPDSGDSTRMQVVFHNDSNTIHGWSSAK